MAGARHRTPSPRGTAGAVGLAVSLPLLALTLLGAGRAEAGPTGDAPDDAPAAAGMVAQQGTPEDPLLPADDAPDPGPRTPAPAPPGGPRPPPRAAGPPG
ncbi:MAG: hypothetical protein VKI81_04040, partial [Synechococcaceae cyanobacterium]|nr:hypothetical protein [Synechococcaceae cyanobacterium]